MPSIVSGMGWAKKRKGGSALQIAQASLSIFTPGKVLRFWDVAQTGYLSIGTSVSESEQKNKKINIMISNNNILDKIRVWVKNPAPNSWYI